MSSQPGHPCADLVQANVKFREARLAAHRRNAYQAWDLILQAHRLLVARASSERQRCLFETLSQEATEKLGGWRKAAATELIKKGPTDGVLVCLMDLVHQESQNQQQKIELMKEQCVAVLVLLIPTLASLLALAHARYFEWAFSSTFEDSNLGAMLLGGFTIGLFGALMSVAFALSKADTSAKIPRLRGSFVVMFLRAVVGAAASVPLVFLVQGGFIHLGDAGPMVLLAACFFAGFSERWFIDRLDKAAASINADSKGKA